MGAIDILTGGWFRCTPAWRSRDGSFADEHRLYFPIRGEAFVADASGVHAIRPGRCWFIPGGRPLRYWCEGSLELTWLHVRPSALALDLRLARLPGPESWPARALARLRPTWLRLAEFFAAPPPALALRVSAMVDELVADVLERHPRLAAIDAGALERFAPALAYLDQHWNDNPPLAAVAATAHLNPQHFHRLFTAAFGVTPHAYVQRRRMARAAELLRLGGLPVKAIAARCGYDDALYFSRAFRRHYRTSPRAFRAGARP
jgi:AraC-like DNA-binding protein